MSAKPENPLEAKECVPTLVDWNTGDPVYRSMPPIRALGSPHEIWGGACGIDRSLMVWDVSTQRGRGAMPAFHARELTVRQRKAFGLYMVALWTEFMNFEAAK